MNIDELIALLESGSERGNEYDDDLMHKAAKTIRILSAVPAADVAPVRHGRWTKHETEDGYSLGANCSACGGWFCMDLPLNFCPACGADMRTSEEPENLTYIPPEERSVVDDD